MRNELPSSEPGKRLRDYAVAIYRQENVSSACLQLQESAHVDLNLLLFAAWATSTGYAVSPSDIQAARALVGSWHSEIVKPLRAVRRRLKHGPSPAPSEETGVLRQKLQSLEIAMELIELDELETFATRLKTSSRNARQRSQIISDALELVVTASAGRKLRADEANAIQQIADICETYGKEERTEP